MSLHDTTCEEFSFVKLIKWLSYFVFSLLWLNLFYIIFGVLLVVLILLFRVFTITSDSVLLIILFNFILNYFVQIFHFLPYASSFHFISRLNVIIVILYGNLHYVCGQSEGLAFIPADFSSHLHHWIFLQVIIKTKFYRFSTSATN